MKELFFALVIHNHQPVGNFPSVFQEAYLKAYLPMVEALERHPTIKATLHYSGPLVDWIKENHPDFFPRLRAMVDRGQIEMMGGGYYEPILPMIPDPDKLGQIRKMNEWIEQDFGKRPSGMWLAERVWEPGLARPIAEAGIQYTLVDDTHFKMVGLDEKDLFGYYVTEEQGYPLKIFPISKHLRYSIPWHPVPQVIDYFKSQASATESRIAVLGDDGEKFGVWPQTYKHCWTDGWIENFFQALEDNRDWLHTIRLGEYAYSSPPVGRVYLPCAAYDEMMEWALPTDKSVELVDIKHRLEKQGQRDVLRYLHGGFWRYFLVKYPEINRMHKRMMQAHRRVYQAEWLGARDIGIDELWKAQCNCPYWHGIFGGIYLTDIRATTYTNIIKAEIEADRALRERVAVSVRSIAEPLPLKFDQVDFDQDGFEELIADNGAFILYFSPREGGSLFEWDIREPPYNLLSTVARRPEPYHRLLTSKAIPEHRENVTSIHDGLRIKQSINPDEIAYDRYPRHSLLDHLLPGNTTMEQFITGSYQSIDVLPARTYRLEVTRKETEMAVILEHRTHVANVVLQKRVSMQPHRKEVQISYRIVNTGQESLDCLFATEWNFNLLGGGHNPHAYYRLPLSLSQTELFLDSKGVHKDIDTVILGNRQLGIELEARLNRKASLWRFPVESISNSEGGVERTYQASCLVFSFPLHIEPGDTFSFGMVWQLREPSQPCR